MARENSRLSGIVPQDDQYYAAEKHGGREGLEWRVAVGEAGRRGCAEEGAECHLALWSDKDSSANREHLWSTSAEVETLLESDSS